MDRLSCIGRGSCSRRSIRCVLVTRLYFFLQKGAYTVKMVIRRGKGDRDSDAHPQLVEYAVPAW
jgi:hypothetical protein